MNRKSFEQKVVDHSVTIARDLPELDRETIHKIIELQLKTLELTSPQATEYNVNVNLLVERVLTVVGATTTVHTMFKSVDHKEWLDRRRGDLKQGIHWRSFEKLMYSKLSEDQVLELDNSTDRILGSIEDPKRPGEWQSRGLVIGDVQSGKTTNFIGLVNKAIDAGYKIIVVLSGLHNNLRTQTQIRFEEGVTGWNTKGEIDTPSRCGVALDPPEGVKPFSLRLGHLTTRLDNGDYLANRQPGLKIGETAVFSVNKKNYKTLENLIKFLETELANLDQEIDVPLLLIDDEADNASINTAELGSDASTINMLMKKLLGLFPKNSYVGYTATPFANVLINPVDEDDLFPRNFIMILGRPDNYIGAPHIFGMINDEGEEPDDDGKYEVQERNVKFDWFVNLDNENYQSDWAEFIPNPNKRESLEFMLELPESLQDAIYSFIISIAVRELRGDGLEHKTMLIHATRLKDLQNRLCELVQDFVDDIYAAFQIEQLDTENPHIERLGHIFDLYFSDIKEPWSEVEPELEQSVSLIKNHVYGINGDHKDIIDEEAYENGLNSIRIGGDKLSRGLTLPGLMTSYFLRVSRMYDTLMQMGRWFGYRSNYDDLCRVFTTAQLFNWFGHVANASESLRNRVFEMNRNDLTPLQYKQQILSHPGMMLVTALNKQRHARSVRITFSQELVQITSFDLTNDGLKKQESNWLNIRSFYDKLSAVHDVVDIRGARILRGVSAENIISLIENFEHTESAGTWVGETIKKYIVEMEKHGELVNWTVAFQTSTKPHELSICEKFDDWEMHSNMRKGGSGFGVFSLEKKQLVSTQHELFDFDHDPFEVEDKGAKTRLKIREKRPPSNGLLIVYLVTPNPVENDVMFGREFGRVPSLAISFPKSDKAVGVVHIVGAGFDGDYLEEDYE